MFSRWKKLSHADYGKLIKKSTVLTKDKYGKKVIRLSDGNIAKLFRRKRIVTSAIIWPYAKRFVWAVGLLEKIGTPTVTIKQVYIVPSIKRHLVLYEPLQGVSLREKLMAGTENRPWLLDFAQFFASLHNKGIYFRAIHFNNVFILEDSKFGLIDVDSISPFLPSPLSLSRRVRNFKAIFHYRQDRQALSEIGMERFLEHYIKNAEFRFKSDPENFQKKVIKLYSSMEGR